MSRKKEIRRDLDELEQSNKNSINEDKTAEYLESALQEIGNVLKLKPDEIKYYHQYCEILIELKRYDEAFETIEKSIVLERVLDLEYRAGVSLFYKFRILKKLKNYENALEIIDLLINDKKYHLFLKIDMFYFHKAKLLYKMIKYEECLKAINDAIELNAEDDAFWHFKAHILLYEFPNNFDDAIISIDKAIEINPEWWGHFSLKVAILKRDEIKQEVISVINEGLKHNPNSDYLYFNKYEYYYELKDYENALKNLNKSIEFYPLRYDEDYSFERYHSKYLLLTDNLKRYNEALEFVDHFYEDNAINRDYYADKAQILFDMNDIQKCMEFLNEGIEKYPEDAFLVHDKSRYLLELKKYQEALNTINSLLEKEYDFYNLDMKYKILFEMKNYDELFKSFDIDSKNFEDAIYTKENRSGFYRMKSKFLIKLGKLDEALNSINNSIDLSPSEFNLNLKAKIFIKMNNFTAALDTIQKSEKLHSWPEPFIIHSKILYEMGKYHECIKICEEWMSKKQLQYYQYRFYILAGISYKELGDYEEAIKLIKTAKDHALQKENEKKIKKAEKYKKKKKKLMNN